MAIAHSIAALVKQQTTTTGTGTLSLGTVPAGARSFVAGVGTGKTVRYHLYGSDGSLEHGEGVVTAGTPDTLSRVTVFYSSLGNNNKISLPVGTHTVALTNGERSIQESTPRALTIGAGVTVSAGIMTVDCMYACDVFFTATLPANITQIIPANVPERCTLYGVISQPGAGGPYTLPQSAWPNETTLETPYYVYTDTTKTRFWLTTTDGGASWVLECNAPLSLDLSPSVSAGALTVDAAGIESVTANVTLAEHVSSVAFKNLPKNFKAKFKVLMSGGYWAIRESAWPAGCTVYPYSMNEYGYTIIEYSTEDGGITASVSAPTDGALVRQLARLVSTLAYTSGTGTWIDQSQMSGTYTTVVMTANAIEVIPFIPPVDVSISQAGVNVVTLAGGALGRVVIYGSDANGLPGQLLLLPSDNLDLGIVGARLHTLAQNFSLAKSRLYYIGLMCSGSPTLQCIPREGRANLGLQNATQTAPFNGLRKTVTYPTAPNPWVYVAADRAILTPASIKMLVA